MQRCNECQALLGASSKVEPASAFEYRSQSWLEADGRKKSVVEHYRCLNCNTRWKRDMDSDDQHAMWEPQ
jgi:hypothetical protein